MGLCRFFAAHPAQLTAQPALLKILDTIFEPAEFGAISDTPSRSFQNLVMLCKMIASFVLTSVILA